MKGVCEYHREPPVEAETMTNALGLKQIVLRCPRCNRIRGLRRIPKATA